MYGYSNNSLAGFLATFSSICVWVALVVYYTFLPELSPITITAYRVLWSFIFISALVTITKQWPAVLAIFKSRRDFFLLILCGFLIGANWLAFILAIKAEKALEASLGAYLNPMLGIAAALFIFKEAVSFLKTVAMILSVLGVAYLIFIYGSIPWYALGISIPFMFYGAVHKILKVSTLDGFFFEMLVLILPAVLYLIFAPEVVPFFQESVPMMFMIMMLGPASALSLVGFAYGIQRLMFSTVSIIQYLYPSMTFLLGLLYFNEPLSGRLPSFLLIWAGVFIYLTDILLKAVTAKRRLASLQG